VPQLHQLNVINSSSPPPPSQHHSLTPIAPSSPPRYDTAPYYYEINIISDILSLLHSFILLLLLTVIQTMSIIFLCYPCAYYTTFTSVSRRHLARPYYRLSLCIALSSLTLSFVCQIESSMRHCIAFFLSSPPYVM
jgi:hypothetical protein